MKQRLLFLFLISAFLLPVTAAAQAADHSVAVLPFAGAEGEEINNRYRETVLAKIGELPEDFSADLLDFPEGTSPANFPPDEMPPPLWMIEGGQRYAVTGLSSFDDMEHHLKIWLWDATKATLIYADEMAIETFDEMDDYAAILVSWVFSHIFNPPQITYRTESVHQAAARPPPPPVVPKDKWIWAGARFGGSIRQYSVSSDGSGQFPYTAKESSLSPSFQVALHGALQILPFLAFQAEAMFTMDFVSFPAFNREAGGSGDKINESIVKLQYMSLMFPLLLKFTYTISPSPFLIAPYGGAYFIVPLGNLEITSPWESEFKSQALPYSRDLPLGWLAGLTFGLKIKEAPGRIYADLRFSGDLGRITFDATPNRASSLVEPFKRSIAISICLGYEFNFLDRK